MSLRNFLTVASIVSFLFGLGFLLVTKPLIALYNVELNAGGVFVGQLFGAALVGYGALNWFARSVTDPKGVQAVVLSNLVENALGFVLALLGQLAGAGGVNQLGWSTVAIYLLLTLDFAYFRFVERSG